MSHNIIWLWYGFWFSCQIRHFGILLTFVNYCLLTFTSKKASLKHVSDKVPRAKWPHGTYGNIMFLSKSGLYNWICYWNLDFQIPSNPPLLCLINSFYRRYVCNMYNRSNRSNRLTRFNRSNLTEQQQFKNDYFSGNFYLLQEPGFSDQENWGGAFFNCFQRLRLEPGRRWKNFRSRIAWGAFWK